MKIQLLTAVTATNSAPSAATDGVSTRGTSSISQGLLGANRAHLAVKSTAGSGTMTCTLKLWGYIGGDVAEWFPLGTSSTVADKGKVNEANALEETDTDTIQHLEVVDNLRGLERVYAEVTAIGGTSTAISAWLVSIDGKDAA